VKRSEQREQPTEAVPAGVVGSSVGQEGWVLVSWQRQGPLPSCSLGDVAKW